MPTLAVHVVWTTYGTWLPGDPHGHWSPLFDLCGSVLQGGGRLNPADVTTHSRAEEMSAEPTKVLQADEITVVADTLGELPGRPKTPAKAGAICPPHAHAAAIEPTHVHLLFGPVEEPIARCVGRLKGVTSSTLLRWPGNQGRTRIWTTGYWKVFLFHADAVAAVKRYVDEHNVHRGLAAEPYAWIKGLETADPA